MSDLYIVLRRRLEDVTDWVELGTPTMRDARKALGLSYEAMGRKLNVAAKTWERWEKAGRVPRYELRRVTDMLEIEIDWPRKKSVTVETGEDSESLESLQGEVEGMAKQLERIESLLRQLVEPRSGEESASEAARQQEDLQRTPDRP